MKMTIDECIDELEWIKLTGIYPYGNTQDKLHTDDYIDVVINIMRKYQKIQEIVNRSDDFIYRNAEYRLQKIKEVIENAKSMR